MCGIFGYWNRRRQALSDEALARSAACIAYRGPDDGGVHHVPARGVAIGNQRLSIIDIGGGHQPMFSDDGQIAVVQNGEIFNYVELAAELRAQGVQLKTASDTEVILRLYERHGIGFVRQLNGMFAIAIDDAREDALYLIRDRIGVKPLYVADDGTHMAFGSEIKAVLELNRPKVSVTPSSNAIDFVAIHHYLSFNYIPAPWTIWQNVKHVMPGTWMKFSRSGAAVQTQRWWSLADQRERDYGFEDWSAEFMQILDDATRIRLRADVPWGAFLSGGVDSSTIVGLMARHVQQPVKTFCIGFADPRYDESAFAAEAARRFGCEHVNEVAELNMLAQWPRVLRHLDQPHGDASFMPTLRVSELAAKHVKVVLTGDGGDELFAGYDKYAAWFARPDAQSMGQADFQRGYFDSISLFSPQAKLGLYQPHLRKQLEGIDSFAEAARPWFDEAGHFDRVNQALYLDMQLLLSGNNLVKPDRMGMAVSIEARTPFLDWRMMELAFRSRGNTKLQGQEKKHWYKKAAAPLIGQDLAYRKKQMFTVPIGDWFRTSSYEWLRELLQKSGLLNASLQAPVVNGMLEAHRAGGANYTRELRALAALALWAEGAGVGGCVTQAGPVLFVTYGGGHIAMVLPVVRALQKRGIVCQVMALTTARKPALQAGLAPLGYRDFLQLVDRDAVLARGRLLADGNQHPDVDALETQSYLGINYSEWVDAHGEAEAARMLAQGGRRAFFPLRFMGRVIDALRPAVVVASNSPRSEQAAIEAAVARGIPTLSMVDLFALDYDPYLKRRVHADRITVLGEKVRDKLVAAGIDSSRIRVTGNPVFDALVQPEHQRQAQALRESLGWKDRTVVLWAGHLEGGADTPAEWRDEKFGLMIERLLRDWVASRSDVALIVRYHPNERQHFPVLPPQPGVYLSDPGREPVHTALLASDAVVVQTTTVGVEAAVAGRNVFALSFSPLVRASGLDYSTLGLAHSVGAPENLVPLLERYGALPVANAGRFNAGHAADAIAAEVAALMPASTPTPADPRPAPSRA